MYVSLLGFNNNTYFKWRNNIVKWNKWKSVFTEHITNAANIYVVVCELWCGSPISDMWSGRYLKLCSRVIEEVSTVFASCLSCHPVSLLNKLRLSNDSALCFTSSDTTSWCTQLMKTNQWCLSTWVLHDAGLKLSKRHSSDCFLVVLWLKLNPSFIYATLSL